MSSRGEYRRRDRSWEKGDRERERSHRSERGGRGGRGEANGIEGTTLIDVNMVPTRTMTVRDREREVDRRDRREPSRRDHEKPSRADDTVQDQSTKSIPPPQSDTRDPKERMDIAEEGEAEDVEQDDSAMMAMMGLSGFGTTKGKQVEGNQEGGADIKKIRTWRQYMNRRGGFNRPLDKIK
ncbi:SNUT3 family protein [Pleurotus pulmonarius]